MKWIVTYRQTRIVEILQQPPQGEPQVTKQEPDMQIFVKTTGFSGAIITLDVHRTYTVGMVKELVFKQSKASLAGNLLFSGKILTNDNLTLEELGIQANSTLHQSFSLSPVPRSITVVVDGFMKITANTNEKVETLKLRLWEKHGIKPSTFSLWKDLKPSGDGWNTGTVLSEKKTLGSFCSAADTLEVSKRKPYNPKQHQSKMSRLDTVKALFHAFINRSIAYNYPTQVGLILFGSTVQETCKITPLFEVFRDHVDSAGATGDTCLYDAIAKACNSLKGFELTHKGCAKRIICLSDGEDTKSKEKPFEVAALLQQHSVILDAIMIAEGSNNKELTAIAKVTGGYVFAPQTLHDAIRLNELETLLYSFERPAIPRTSVIKAPHDLNKYKYLPIDECDENTVPKRRVPEFLEMPVQSLKKTLENAEKESASASAATKSNKVRRILQELKALMKDPHSAVEIFPCQHDVGFWRAIVQGPESSPYQGGTWLLYVSFPDDYPLQSPEVRFVTPIRHCNVNPYGKICHSIFTRNWTSDTTMVQVISCIYGLLLFPETEDPLDTTLAMQFHSNPGAYEADIKKHVQKHAKSKNMIEWRAELTKEFEDEQELCKICFEKSISMVMVPCGHLCTCENCANRVTDCPVCRKPIQAKQPVYKM